MSSSLDDCGTNRCSYRESWLTEAQQLAWSKILALFTRIVLCWRPVSAEAVGVSLKTPMSNLCTVYPVWALRGLNPRPSDYESAALTC